MPGGHDPEDFESQALFATAKGEAETSGHPHVQFGLLILGRRSKQRAVPPAGAYGRTTPAGNESHRLERPRNDQSARRANRKAGTYPEMRDIEGVGTPDDMIRSQFSRGHRGLGRDPLDREI